MIELTGLHLLLSYQCNYECDHCFVWSSPWQSGTLTLDQIKEILHQGQELGTVREIYFEGGEPFLYYAVLVKGVQMAAQAGFSVGIVSNSYWATSVEDATAWLQPFVGLIDDLSLSNDLFHGTEEQAQQVRSAITAAEALNIPIGTISIAQPEAANAGAAMGQLPSGESKIMYRGRAAYKLIERAAFHPCEQFTECPYENLRDPGRVHIDPLGYVHICQGISLGNVFQKPLREIVQSYEPDAHPITGPLLAGGPMELAQHHKVLVEEYYADACHLCYTTREKLRARFPDVLAPDQIYGVY